MLLPSRLRDELVGAPSLNRSLWKDVEADGLKGPALCAYVSRLIGSDTRLVLWGGGNSSVKTTETDHAGRRQRVVWVKASGFDMKNITADGFTALRLDELERLRSRETMDDFDMVSYQMRCSLDPKAARPSIETLMHAWIPSPHVYHTHADAVAGFTCTPGSRERTYKVFGPDVLWIPYVRPGFSLAKMVIKEVVQRPSARALILDKHGALTWGVSAREAYEAMIDLTRRAMEHQLRLCRPRKSKASSSTSHDRKTRALELLPLFRGEAGKTKRVVLRWIDTPEVLRFLDRADARELSSRGPFSPDHTLQIKARALFYRPGGRVSVAQAMEGYRSWYRGYYKRYAPAGAPVMDPNPRVILVPGVGLLTTGRDPGQALIPQEIYLHTMEVVSRIADFTRYTPLDPRHLGDIEFWEMETYKYKLLPPEAEFSRRVVLVTGAAGAIGAVTAEMYCARGASVVLGDIDFAGVKRLESAFNAKYGKDRALAVRLDVTSETSVRHAFSAAVLAYGGLDILFSNAGIARSAPVVDIALSDWEKSFAVNATGHFLCSREAMLLFKRQGLGGVIVFNASKNVLAPGKDFAAYSASKAAETQLARVLALEGGAFGVRVNIVNPDAVFEGSGLWSASLRRGRASAQGIDPARLEEHYVSRNLLKQRVRSEDVAESVLFLSSDRSSRTTGAILPVDGGLREAFPR